MKIFKLFLTIFLVFFSYQVGVPEESDLISFKLKDQFDRVYSDNDFENKILIVVGSDKTGSQYNREWIDAILDSLKKGDGLQDVRFLGVADLRGVPFFLKGYVKGKFPDQKSRWVLMDWDGKFAKHYQFKADVCNIAIINRKDRLIYQTSGTQLDFNKLNEILRKLRASILTVNSSDGH